MIKKGELDKYGAKIPGTTPKDWTEGYVDYKEDGVVTFGGKIPTQPEASSSAVTMQVDAEGSSKVTVVKDDEDKDAKKEKKRKRKSEAPEDGLKTEEDADKKVRAQDIPPQSKHVTNLSITFSEKEEEDGEWR
jgi:H/ACA ribonucleoprotein complex subunit 4